MSGRGRLYSWTTVEHQVHPAYPVPYTIVLVELDDEPGVRLIGYLPGAPELTEGQPMQVWFETSRAASSCRSGRRANEEARMSWDFETEPEFQEELDWVDDVRAGPRSSRSTSSSATPGT